MSRSQMLSALQLTLSRIRYREAIIFQAPTPLGLAMFVPDFGRQSSMEALLACMGSFLLAASILAINDWADISMDSQNILKRDDTFLGRGIARIRMLWLAGLLAAVAVIVFSTLSKIHVVAALAAIVLGLAYSLPIGGTKGKCIPVFSSILHFSGTLLAFLLGALTFASVDGHTLLAAIYPGFLITAGHLVHEVEDCEQDRISDCQTNAVRFGPKRVFVASTILFGFSFVLLSWLAMKGVFPYAVIYAPFLFLAYAVLAIRAFQAGLTRDSIHLLRTQYRVLYGFVVALLIVASLLVRRGVQ